MMNITGRMHTTYIDWFEAATMVNKIQLNKKIRKTFIETYAASVYWLEHGVLDSLVLPEYEPTTVAYRFMAFEDMYPQSENEFLEMCLASINYALNEAYNKRNSAVATELSHFYRALMAIYQRHFLDREFQLDLPPFFPRTNRKAMAVQIKNILKRSATRRNAKTCHARLLNDWLKQMGESA